MLFIAIRPYQVQHRPEPRLPAAFAASSGKVSRALGKPVLFRKRDVNIGSFTAGLRFQPMHIRGLGLKRREAPRERRDRRNASQRKDFKNVCPVIWQNPPQEETRRCALGNDWRWKR